MARLTTEYKGDMLFQTSVGTHSVLADVPEAWGGKNRGLTPPQLLVTSIGACVGAVVANYCNKVGLDAEGMKVDVEFEKADDPVRLQDIEIFIELPNVDVTGREKAIKRVAEHCPVHETICSISRTDIHVSGQK